MSAKQHKQRADWVWLDSVLETKTKLCTKQKPAWLVCQRGGRGCLARRHSSRWRYARNSCATVRHLFNIFLLFLQKKYTLARYWLLGCCKFTFDTSIYPINGSAIKFLWNVCFSLSKCRLCDLVLSCATVFTMQVFSALKWMMMEHLNSLVFL